MAYLIWSIGLTALEIWNPTVDSIHTMDAVRQAARKSSHRTFKDVQLVFR